MATWSDKYNVYETFCIVDNVFACRYVWHACLVYNIDYSIDCLQRVWHFRACSKPVDMSVSRQPIAVQLGEKRENGGNNKARPAIKNDGRSNLCVNRSTPVISSTVECTIGCVQKCTVEKGCMDINEIEFRKQMQHNLYW